MIEALISKLYMAYSIIHHSLIEHMDLVALFVIALLLSIAIAYIHDYHEKRFPGTSEEFRQHVHTLMIDTVEKIFMTAERLLMKATPASLWQTTVYGQSLGRILLLALFWQFLIPYLMLRWLIRNQPRQ